MQYTANYAIPKPEYTDQADILAGVSVAHDLIDTQIKTVADDVSQAETDITALDTRVDNIIASSGTSSTEVVDARNSTTFGQTFTVLKDRHEYTEQIVKNLSTPLRSPNQTTQSPVTSYPTATEDGLVHGTIGGQSLVNAVVNGNFVNTTGWSATASVISATNNTLSITGDGADSNPRTAQQIPITLTTGKKVYIRASGRVTNSVCTSMDFYVNGVSGGTLVNIGVISTPIQNQFYHMSGILTVTNQTGKFFPRIRHNYAAAATANSKVMEVRDVIAIDLDAHGLTSKTVAELDAMSDAYFEGLASVVNPVVVSEGKNILNGDPTQWEQGAALASVGQTYDAVKTVSTTRVRVKNLFRGRPGAPISFSVPSGMQMVVQTYNSIGRQIADTGWRTQGYTFTTSSDTAYLYAAVSYVSAATITTADLVGKQIQLEEGTTATTYEPYTSNTLSIPATLRSLPNGVRDTVVQSGNGVVTLTQNVQEYTLVSGDVLALTTTPTNIDYVTIKIPDTCVLPSVPYESDKIITTFSVPAMSNYSDSAALIGKHGYGTQYVGGTTRMLYIVAKGTYANLAAAQTALTGTKILYQLATPVVTTLQTDDWISYKSGRFVTNTAIVPQAVINTPINLAEKGESTFVMASNSEAKLSSIAMPIPLINTETTISNIASALTEVNTAYRTKYDLSKCGACRVTTYVKTVGSASAEVRVQYSLDESTWNYLDGLTGPAINISATGTKASAWSSIASLAKADVFIRVVTINGDGAADPVIGNVVLQVR